MQPPIRLDLTPEQRAELDRRLRARATEVRVRERLEMVRAVADGLTVPQAARALGRHPQTVRQAVKRFAAEGFAGLVDRPRPGRPPRLTVSPAQVRARLRRRGFRWKRTKRATTHKQGDRSRQAEAAADLAVWRFGGP